MRVRDATYIGLFLGLAFGYSSFQYNELIGFINWGFSLTSIIMGQKIVKGTTGGLMTGIGLGIFGGTIIQQSMALI